MEEKLLKLFKIADSLNEKQDNVYVYITYSADKFKTLEIAIRSKKDFTYKESIKFHLGNNSIIKLDNIINSLESYTGGTSND